MGIVIVVDKMQLVGCDKQREGTPNQRHGVPALALVTPYRFMNWRAWVVYENCLIDCLGAHCRYADDALCSGARKGPGRIQSLQHGSDGMGGR